MAGAGGLIGWWGVFLAGEGVYSAGLAGEGFTSLVGGVFSAGGVQTYTRTERGFFLAGAGLGCNGFFQLVGRIRQGGRREEWE